MKEFFGETDLLLSPGKLSPGKIDLEKELTALRIMAGRGFMSVEEVEREELELMVAWHSRSCLSEVAMSHSVTPKSKRRKERL